MRIFVYTVCRNERVIMPYFLRHYGQFAEQIVVYDDKSEDGTREIVKEHKEVTLRDLAWTGIDDELSLGLWQECKAEALAQGADWVICVDTDELIYHPQLFDVLRQTAQDAIKAEGWQMLSDKLPSTYRQIYEEITQGVRDDCFDKTVVFRPACDIGWCAGRHFYTGECSVKDDAGLKLLHYRYLGEPYAAARAAEHGKRLTQNNRSHGWGVHVDPGYQGNQSLPWFKKAITEKRECL
jgi:glycosyltransferase involved in cell wall biosynthesis